MTIARRRIQSELRGYFLDQTLDPGVKIEVRNGDFMNLKGIIKGVEGTPYEGGTFELEIKIGTDYPYKPPTIKFLTKIWHPHVNPFNGTICLEDADNGVWPVSMSVYKVLLLIQSWMTKIDDKQPIDVEILHQATNNTQVFNTTAEFWAIKFAGARKPASQELLKKVQLLTPVARNEVFAVIALSYHNWELPNDIHEETIQKYLAH
uniref:UBIQUITIN_CONJUGAT_2 domain-containing protein n=1 Tax=Caenorhabditis tropicalis TaxID=1561998 RepID=A0A1I7TR33_9PELO